LTGDEGGLDRSEIAPVQGACEHPVVEAEQSVDRGPGRDPNRARAAADRVVRRLRSAGHEALLAGGCVRDLLLDREPGDYDVATSARAEQVRRLFPRTIPVGVQFGVVLVIQEGVRIEVATFRRDGVYLDHRHPAHVEFCGAREDALRRDFTINGMFLDPETNEVLDYVGGRADLEAGVLRAIGNPTDRFDEDRLRLMRAVRFAARFGYAIEAATWEAVRRLAPGIAAIAAERIGEEIVKILVEGSARRGFELLSESGLLEIVLPEIEAMRGVEQSPEHHPEGDVFAHTLSCLAKVEKRHGEALALAVLLHDVAKPLTQARRPDGRITFHGHCEEGAALARAICRRLRRSREVGERVAWLVEHHLRHIHVREMRVATLRRFLGHPDIEDLLELVRIDALSGSGDLSSWEFCRERMLDFGEEPPRPEPLLRGRDLLDLGYRAGPAFGRILEAAYDAQLEGEVGSNEAARDWVRARFPIGDEGGR
jgi:poly(A) polymerase